MNKTKKSIILASASPRRRELLQAVGIEPIIMAPQIDEEPRNENPNQLVRRLSKEKAMAVYHQLSLTTPPSKPGQREGKQQKLEASALLTLPILAADTVVCLGKSILGKPADKNEAFAMLSSLSGKTHKVKTGWTLRFPNGKILTKITTTKVTFRPLSINEIHQYLELNEWSDAAGSYKIQEEGKTLVASVNGSLTNVIGLPLEAIFPYLENSNIA